MLQVKTTYTPNGSTLDIGRATVKIGSNEGEFHAYDFLLGALSACFQATLADILIKRKLEIPTMEIIVTGEKRKETPTTLEWTKMDITVFGEVDEEKFLRSADLATKYCSVHTTISKVATMTHEVKFRRS